MADPNETPKAKLAIFLDVGFVYFTRRRKGDRAIESPSGEGGIRPPSGKYIKDARNGWALLSSEKYK